MATILTKRSNTASSVPVAGDLTNSTGGAELAVNTADKRLFTKDSGGTVVELGTNPSSLTLASGTANAVPYLNGSKVLTTGSGLQFDGTNLGLGVTPSAWGAARRVIEVGGTTVVQFASASTYGTFSTNLYVDSSNWRYKNNGYGMIYSQDANGSHIWYNVASGTAGNIASLTQAMTLDASGRLGLGVTSPSLSFEVGQNTAKGYMHSGVGVFSVGTSTNHPYAFDINGTERARIDSSGNLGLGVTPSALASANKAVQVRNFLFEDSTNGYGIVRYNNFYNGTNDVYISNGYATTYMSQSGAHKWYTAPSGTAGNAISFTQAMTLDASGNLLVGTTSLGANSSGNGSVIYGGADAGIIYVYRSAGTDMFRFYVNNSMVGRITTTSSATSYVTSSDYRLKENIVPMTGALAKVAALKPVTYTWKIDGADGQGFIAHELQAVCPDAVVGEKDAVDENGNPVYQGIDTSFLVATLTAAIQELKAEVDALKSEINTLKGI